MTVSAPDRLVADYLRELERAARVLPRSDRMELLDDVRAHLATGRGSDASSADIRNLLDDLGRPEAIVAAAHSGRSHARRGPREVFGVLLLSSGFPPVLGWLVGVGLLLWSPLWSPRQKLLGLLVWPGGFVGALGAILALSSTPVQLSCELTVGGGLVPGSCIRSNAGLPFALVVLALAVAVIGSLLVGVHLYRAAGRQGETS